MSIRKWLQSLFGQSKARDRAEIDGSIIELQMESSMAAVVRYTEKGSRLSFDAEWSSTKDNLAFLNVTLPKNVSLDGVVLDDSATTLVASRISRGLLQIGIKYCQIIQRGPSIPIASEESEAGLAKLQERMAAEGWNVTYDKPAGTMTWERPPGAEARSPAGNAQELGALALKAGEWIRGYRTEYRILVQTPGIHL